MEKSQFGRAIIDTITKAENEAGGTTVTIGNAFLRESVDYADTTNVRVMASNAVHTANGLYELISKNCDTAKPSISKEDHLEIFLALAGLTCEIYMKSIIYNEFMHGDQKLKKHYLDELFEMLPDNIQTELSAKIPKLKEAVGEIKDIFIKLRYDFELNTFAGNYLVVFQLMEELKSISNRYPTETRSMLSYAAGIAIIE